MPDVSSNAPAVVRMRAAFDVHKRTIVCAAQTDDPRGELRLEEIPNSERAVRGLVRRLGGPEGLVVCYEAGPCGYDRSGCSARSGWRATSSRRR